MCRDEGLHESHLGFYRVFADIAVLFVMKSSFVVQQFDVAFTYDAFRILSVPFFGCREEEVIVK